MSYLTVADVRDLPNLADTNKFPDAVVGAAVEWFETTFESYTGVAWEPRTRTIRLSGNGGVTLPLPGGKIRSVTSVWSYTTATAYTEFTSAELADLVVEWGQVRRFATGWFPLGSANLVVTYSHGFDVPPADVLEAAKAAVRWKLLDDTVGNRQFSIQTEQGVVRTSTPGPDRPFGIPFVDEVANRRRVGGTDLASVPIA